MTCDTACYCPTVRYFNRVTKPSASPHPSPRLFPTTSFSFPTKKKLLSCSYLARKKKTNAKQKKIQDMIKATCHICVPCCCCSCVLDLICLPFLICVHQPVVLSFSISLYAFQWYAVVITCNPLEAPDNGSISGDCGSVLGSVCTVACNVGHVVGSGTVERTCTKVSERKKRGFRKEGKKEKKIDRHMNKTKETKRGA